MLRTNKTGWIGLDLGAACVKAAQAVRQGNKCFIRAAAIVPRPDGWSACLNDDAVPRSSADELCAVISVADRFTGAAAGVALPTSLCDVTQVDATVLGNNEPGALVQAVEAATHRPLDAFVVDWRPSPLKGDRLNVVVAPRRWSDQICSDVAAAGRRCRTIDAMPWALARAVSLAYGGSPPGAVVAVDWGHSAATACLICDGVPALVRRLKGCGFEQFVATVAHELRLQRHDAERLLRTHGLERPVGSASCASVVESVLGASLERVERELARTLQHWRGHAREAAPDGLYLFGAGASLIGVDRRFSETLNLQAVIWSLPAEPGADAACLPPAYLLGSAVGLSALAWEA